MIPAKQEEEPAAGRVSNIPFRAKTGQYRLLPARCASYIAVVSELDQ
jgi:hypothetical protein